MATSFYDIYVMNDKIMEDRRLQSVPLNVLYRVLFDYLVFAIGEFEEICYKDLTDRDDFLQETYSLVGDGATDEFSIAPSPTIGYDGICVVIDGVLLDEDLYSYSSEDEALTFTSPPSIGTDISVAFYTIGEFEEDLSTQEKAILATGMIVPFVKSQTFLTKNLQQIMTGGSFKMFSQANHTKTNLDALKAAKDDFREMINRYSYHSNPNGYTDIAGEGFIEDD